MSRLLGAAILAVLVSSTAAAQQKPAAAGAAEVPAAPSSAAAPSAPVEAAPAEAADAYVYRPDGRRDPFLNLLGTGVDTSDANLPRAEGVAGLMTDEISVRGVLQSPDETVAMVQGPDNRSHVVRQGDKLRDGVVKAVVPEGLVIMQEVNDPLSLVKQREVRRLLRSLEDGKE